MKFKRKYKISHLLELSESEIGRKNILGLISVKRCKLILEKRNTYNKEEIGIKEENFMKVRLTKEAKKWLTLEQAPIAHQIIKGEKENETTAAEYAEMVIRAVYFGSVWDVEVLKADASIAGNCRIWNQYGDESGTLDIWIDATAYVDNGNSEFIIIGCYFSDICQLSGNYEDNQDLISHMYIRRFKEDK